MDAHQEKALVMVATERQRQVTGEGYTSEHDEQHRVGELAKVAAALLVWPTDAGVEDVGGFYDDDGRDPWHLIDKHGDDSVRLLVIAGALVLAELERRLRSEHL